MTPVIVFGKLLLDIVKNPLIIGTVLGLVFVLLGLRLPSSVESAVRDMGRAASPLLLFLLGAFFHFDGGGDHRGELIAVCLARLVVFPAVALSHVNEQLCEGNEAELFVTVWLAKIDLRTGKGMAANAGHEHPALRRADEKYELVVYRHSPAVATMEGMRFREHEFQLNPGDSLFVYTDGVAEATDAHNELYGSDRMLEALNADPMAKPDQLLPAVKRSIDAFVGEAPQFDDITMLNLQYYGPRTKTEAAQA